MEEISNVVHCYKCRSKLEFSAGDKILRHEECGQCKCSLHCCKMCHFYDVRVYNECRETLAERILEKEKPNFCSYFILADGGSNKGPSAEDMVSKANSLFKN